MIAKIAATQVNRDMASFPIFKSLEVSSYGLYPGSDGTGLSVSFGSGLTLILGANGLGKSTLITILFRELTGPFDLALPSGSIGTAELKAFAMGPYARGALASRVNDAAKDAEATLTFELGRRLFVITRSLHDLALRSLLIDGISQSFDEVTFQREIIAGASVATFGEWILILRTMVFFFEDRRSLVWDRSAQRQLLRCLLLPAEQASLWAKAEREILEEDTRMRNLQSALRREQRETDTAERRVGTAPGVVAALRAAQAATERLEEQQSGLIDRVEELDQLRHRNRLDYFRAQADHDGALQELERARLAAVESRFPSADESMRYVFSRLMADDECLVCKTKGLEAKRLAMVLAIATRHCVVCDSVVANEKSDTVDISEERIQVLTKRAEATAEAAHACSQSLETATKNYAAASDELGNCLAELSRRQEQVASLTMQLPPEEQALHRQHDDLKALEDRVTALRASIRSKRAAFGEAMAVHRETIRRYSDGIKTAFETASHGFLLEDSALSWAPYRLQVGQAGPDGVEPVDYPAFQVELSGADFVSVVRRDSPDQVSESQREFIDLAFRMALIHVASDNQAGSIVVDAPESSLDAVFVDRATAVLARFANSNSLNRLIVTSNLAAGDLVPKLVVACEPDAENRARRIVDLFSVGVPTRAMKELADEYASFRQALYAQLAIPLTVP